MAGDDAEAARWFRKAAEQGNATGEYSLGEMYASGRGVKKDYKEASKWIQKAADQGEVRAQTDLGAMYLLGLGVNQNDKKAFQLTRMAAEQGSAAAEFGLGTMYSRGQGVPRDLTEAANWYTKAVDQGNPDAMNNLSWLLATGTNPSDRNPRAAIELALRATRVTQERRPEYFDTLANAYFANQQYAEALGAIQKALLLKPDHIGYQQLFQKLSGTHPGIAGFSRDCPARAAEHRINSTGGRLHSGSRTLVRTLVRHRDRGRTGRSGWTSSRAQHGEIRESGGRRESSRRHTKLDIPPRSERRDAGRSER